MDLSDSGFQDQTNKAGPSNTKSNISETYKSDNEKHGGSITELSNTSKSYIDLTEASSDSDDEDSSYYVTAVWDISDVESSPSPIITSSPTPNGDLSCVILDNTEILEENNNDPNNNLSFMEIQQESISSTSVIDISKDEIHKIDCSKELNSPIPGCSKDMAIEDKSNKMHEEAKLISTLLPEIEFDLIVRTLKKNQYAKNYVELTLEDLLNRKKSMPQILSKRRMADDACAIERKKSVSDHLDMTSEETETSNVEPTEKKYLNTTESINFKFVHSCEENIKRQSREQKSPVLKDTYKNLKHSIVLQNSILDECPSYSKENESKDILEIQEKGTLNEIKNKMLYAFSPIIRPAKLIVPKSVPPQQSQFVTCTNNTILAPAKLTYVSKYIVNVTDNEKPACSVTDPIPILFTSKKKEQNGDICEGVVNTSKNDLLQKNIFSERAENSLLPNGEIYSNSSKSTSEVNSDIASDIKNINASQNSEILLPSLDISRPYIEFVPSLNNGLNLPSTSKGITESRSINSATNLQDFQKESTLNILPTNYTNGLSIAELIKIQKPKFDKSSAATEIPNKTTEDVKLSSEMMRIYYKLLSMFPHVNPDYIKSLCAFYDTKGINLDDSTELHTMIEHLLVSGDEHPRIVNMEMESTETMCDVNEQYENMLGIFPDADPTYLRDVVEIIYNKPEELKAFVQSKLENHDYPTREQYLAKIKITDQQKQYTTEFKIDKFLEIFPDPFSYFEDPQRKCIFHPVGLEFLKHHYNKLRVSTILFAYGHNKNHLSLTARVLDKIQPDLKGKRITSYLTAEDIPLLQEITFIQHREQIRTYLKNLKENEAVEFQILKENNGLLECQCCFDNECMPSKCSNCDNGHTFCNACIIKGAEVKLAESETHIRCFVNCTSEFSLSTLQKILPPTTFSILLKKRQEAEIMAAGLEGLVSCPFCHFASIPPPTDKVFKCFNPDCMKESCRSCKELNHVPLSCDEVSFEKAHHYLEEKMTQALIHTCYKCNRPFFKEEGCNKMTCVCGAAMCYICDQPVTDYKHFRGQGSTQTDLCPLWSDNHVINAKAVLKVAKDIEIEIKQKNPNIKLVTQPLLPKLPSKTKGPHDDIPNSDVIPERAFNIRLHK